jgi:hypothetical protein
LAELSCLQSSDLGPTGAYITGFFARMFVSVAKALFWSKPLTDFEKQLAEVEEAKDNGLIRPTLILPPILNDGEKTNTYRSGKATMMKDAMGVTKFVSRACMADLCLKLGEKVASGEESVSDKRAFHATPREWYEL